MAAALRRFVYIVLSLFVYLLKTLSNNSSIIKYLSLAFGVVFIVGNSLNVNIYFSGIQTKEYAALKKAFNTVSNENKIVLIRPRINFLQQEKFYKRKYADEYGQLSSDRDWVPVPLFHQVVSENSKEATSSHVISISIPRGGASASAAVRRVVVAATVRALGPSFLGFRR